jgi:hypothetical protein
VFRKLKKSNATGFRWILDFGVEKTYQPFVENYDVNILGG